MADYFTISGDDIKDKEITADTLWDEVDLEGSKDVTIFTDLSTSCNMDIHVPDLSSDVTPHISFSIESEGDQVLLTGNYPSIQVSIDTDNTGTAFYNVG